MNKYFHKISALLTLASFLCIMLFSSCQDRVDNKKVWRANNERLFNAFADSTGFNKVSLDGTEAYVYMKQLQPGDGKHYPIQTSRVLVHYQLELLTGNNRFIEGNFDSEAPTQLSITRGEPTDCIKGLGIALQNMTTGEECDVIVPWYLGYGESESDGIPGYSTLRFRVRLDAIIPETAN